MTDRPSCRRRHRAGRAGARALSLLLAAVVLVIGSPGAAHAHATLLFATPSVDGAVPDSPTEIQLVFDQRVVPAATALKVSVAGGADVRVGRAKPGHDGQSVTARVQQILPPGEYVVDWFVTAADGDTMAGEFRFAVGSSSGLALGSASTDSGIAVQTLTLRWLLFLGLALVLGAQLPSE